MVLKGEEVRMVPVNSVVGPVSGPVVKKVVPPSVFDSAFVVGPAVVPVLVARGGIFIII